MEVLRIQQCSDSLTLSILSDHIIPRIRTMKKIQMPEKMAKEDEQLAHSVMENFQRNWPRVKLGFGTFRWGGYNDDCSFLSNPRS